MKSIRVGTAGWSVPPLQAQRFATRGSHLERYAAVMNCVEVNSSFYRPHQRRTWQRWAAVTPPGFQFSVKAPKVVTHVAKLLNCADVLTQFFEQIAGLDEKLGPVLFQFAPGHIFDKGLVRDFLGMLREMHRGLVAFEPRNASWFSPEADRLLLEFKIARVAADPAKGSPLAAKPGGEKGLRYYRLHGSPRIYWSSYNATEIESLTDELRDHESGERWVIFDNTAAGEALKNALELSAILTN
jgi:uncharacterized protein YecE (DUF72 family)